MENMRLASISVTSIRYDLMFYLFRILRLLPTNLREATMLSTSLLCICEVLKFFFFFHTNL